MEYILSRHAKEKIEKRKIPVDLVEKVMNFPDQVIFEDNLAV